MDRLLFKRPCLLVQDLSRSLSLYQDILGFTLTYQSPADSDSYLYTLFNLPSEATVTFAAFDAPDQPRALALTEVKNIDANYFSPPARVALVTQVDSVADIIEDISALSLKVMPPNHFETESNLKFTEQGIHDFDGNLLILYSCDRPG